MDLCLFGSFAFYEMATNIDSDIAVFVNLCKFHLK